MPKMIEVECTMNPAITRLRGKTFVCGGNLWLEVPEGTTLKDIKWKRPKIEVFRPEVREETFKSKSSDKVYTASVSTDGSASCNCYGFQYRRKCCHVTELKRDMGIK